MIAGQVGYLPVLLACVVLLLVASVLIRRMFVDTSTPEPATGAGSDQP